MLLIRSSHHPPYIPDRYLMMHGGIGRLEWLSEIAAVKRPLRTDYEYGGVLTDVVSPQH